MGSELQCGLDRVGDRATLLAEVRRYLVHHHLRVSAPDVNTLIGTPPSEMSTALVDPLHVADEIIVSVHTLGSGALRVEGRLTTRRQTRTLALALTLISAVAMGIIGGIWVSQSRAVQQLISRPDSDDPGVTLALWGLLLLTLSLPVIILGALITQHLLARRRALTLLRCALAGLSAERAVT
jgi:hypothetical protein